MNLLNYNNIRFENNKCLFVSTGMFSCDEQGENIFSYDTTDLLLCQRQIDPFIGYANADDFISAKITFRTNFDELLIVKPKS